MAISLYNIKKWVKMFSGDSIYHVNQPLGKRYSKTNISGYYNDLTEKVLRDDLNKIPTYHYDTGKSTQFSIMIFQYALGAYDLYLETSDSKYKDKFLMCVDWAILNQQDNGSWDTFSFQKPDHPYSSMAQSEGASTLLRAYNLTGNKNYLVSAKKALDFMLLNIDDGGTAIYQNEDLILLETTAMSAILNGWIFSIFGLYDYLLVEDNLYFQESYEMTINTLKKYLKEYDLGYWSKYDMDNMIASPFYHNLHVVLLEVLADISEDNTFLYEAKKYENYASSKINRYRAIIQKGLQKISL